MKDKIESNDIKALEILKTHRNYLRASKISYFSRLPLHIVKKSLEKLERLRYIICSPTRRIKKPHEFVKEYAQKGLPPTDIYTEDEKEYKITRRGLGYLNSKIKEGEL